MDALNRWFSEATQTPVGGVLLFLLVYLTRVALDRLETRRARKKQKRHKPKPS